MMTHTHTHEDTHANTHTRTHSRILTHTHRLTHTHSHTLTHTQTPTHSHTHTLTHSHTHIAVSHSVVIVSSSLRHRLFVVSFLTFGVLPVFILSSSRHHVTALLIKIINSGVSPSSFFYHSVFHLQVFYR